MSTDRIEKKVLLHASLKRVWRALADSGEFGSWFGIRFEGAFSPGAVVRGVITPTTVDPVVAKAQEPYAGKRFEVVIEKMVAERLFSFRWHPHAVDANHDYSAEPMTLVEFALEDVKEGVMLTVTESGFDQIPAARRTQAFTANDGGWGMVVGLIAKYVAE
jgi:uncharacterized protein YndB with AHSA1/START domain